MTSNLRLACAAASLCLLGSQVQAAGFFEDSKGSLMLRNFYFDRDFRSGSGQSEAKEWAQGFILRLESGFTQGPVGFGLDATGQLGVKLDSSPDRTGTGLLAYDPVTRKVGDSYSKLGLTGKMRISRTDVQAGTLQPLLPIALAVPARVFPPLFRGAYLKSQEIDKLTLHGGYLDQIKLRDSTNHQDMSISNPNGRFSPGAWSDRFTFGGADYRWSEQLNTRYFYASLDQLYQQHYLEAVHFLPLGPGKIKTDLRYFDSREDGAAKAGKVDNRNLNLMFTWLQGGHALGLGYMHLSGATGMPYLGGTDPNVNTEGALVTEYLNPDERVWQFKYDYNFAAQGLPGLRAMFRYISADNIDLAATSAFRSAGYRGKERERDLELAYTVQSGSLKNLSLRLRQGSYRSDFARDANEVRVNIDYTLALW